MRTPAISVIMPVYNGKAFLSDAIRSVLDQSFGDFELLVVDDASTDGSAKAIAGFRDERLKLIRLKKNRGLAGARNRALAEARGKYIAFLDCDDTSEPGRFQRQWQHLERRPDIGLIATWTDLFGTDSGPGCRSSESPEQIDARLLFEDPIATSSVMLRRSLLDGEEGPFDTRFPPAEDYQLWTRLARKTRLAVLPVVLVRYRCHAQQTSGQQKGRIKSVRRAIYSEQLAQLGLKAGHKEMIWHDAFTQGSAGTNHDFFIGALGWMLRVANANRHSLRYRPQVLGSLLREKLLGLAHRMKVDFELWAVLNRRLAGSEFALAPHERLAHLFKWLKCLRAARKARIRTKAKPSLFKS